MAPLGETCRVSRRVRDAPAFIIHVHQRGRSAGVDPDTHEAWLRGLHLTCSMSALNAALTAVLGSSVEGAPAAPSSLAVPRSSPSVAEVRCRGRVLQRYPADSDLVCYSDQLRCREPGFLASCQRACHMAECYAIGSGKGAGAISSALSLPSPNPPPSFAPPPPPSPPPPPAIGRNPTCVQFFEVCRRLSSNECLTNSHLTLTTRTAQPALPVALA